MIFSDTFGRVTAGVIWNKLFRTPGPISIYSGVQPTAETIENSWSNYKSSDASFLAHYPAPTWSANTSVSDTQQTYSGGSSVFYSAPNWNGLGSTPVLFSTTGATANVTPLHSGTAAWAIIWDNTVVSAPNASTIPTTNFMVVPVGGMTSNSSIRLITTSISTSANSRVEDAGITITSP
jgi:hypothetical protein